MNGLQAVTQNFIAAQTYPGPTPKMGFVAPVLYQLGNSPNYQSYFRDIECGNTANPTSGPDGDAATKGWDAATGWGEPDWFNFSDRLRAAARRDEPERAARRSTGTSRGRARRRRATRPSARFSCPTTSTCYAVGAASGAHAVVRQVPRRPAPGAR